MSYNSPRDQCERINLFKNKFNFKNRQEFFDFIKKLYLEDKMSAIEISEYLYKETNEPISPRSVQRWVVKMGINRTVGESFRLAGSRGRVHWAYKTNKIIRNQLPSALRLEILKRDKYRCVNCGATRDTAILEVEHRKAVTDGGSNDKSNLRVYCHECNMGKAIKKGEIGWENAEIKRYSSYDISTMLAEKIMGKMPFDIKEADSVVEKYFIVQYNNKKTYTQMVEDIYSKIGIRLSKCTLSQRFRKYRSEGKIV